MLKKFIFAAFASLYFGWGFTSEAQAVTIVSTSTVAEGDLSTVKASTDTAVILSSGMLPAPSPTASVLDQRIAYERFNRANPFVLTPYHANYVLPFSYNFNPNESTFNTGGAHDKIQNTEMKFQLSLKVNLIKDLIKDTGDLYVAYTQQSYWQAYNTKDSSPFRETNYGPEAGFTLYDDLHFLGFRSRMVTLAVMHQSNGRSGNESRSWNRLFGDFVVQRGNFYLSFRPWYRIPEAEGQDDNPELTKYLGNGDLTFNYDYRKHLISVLVRNNLRSDNKGAVRTEWSFPIGPKVRGFLQYFYGYGESLIDYNHINHRVGLGFSISNGL